MPGETEIKPCPFCGGPAAIVRGCTHLNAKWQFKVFCKRCQVRQPLRKTKCGAITEWNHRAKLVGKNGSSYNTGSPKSAYDIVESDDICDYCARDSSECTIFSCDDKHSGFVGRKLRAGA